MKLVIPICDQNLFLLPIYRHQFKRYELESLFEPVVVGFKEPAEQDWCEFVSIADSQDKPWTLHLFDYVNSIHDEHIVFTLEDFLPVARPDFDSFNVLMSSVLTNNIGRADLTWDMYCNCRTEVYNTLEDKPYSLISCPRFGRMTEGESLYRITTQPSIWKREYLLKFLNNQWSPWDFEVTGSILSASFEEDVIAVCDPTFKRYPTRWTPKGAVSRHQPGKFNCLGMPVDNIRELVDLGLVHEKDLIWGMWKGAAVDFHVAGGYNFSVDNMPKHAASPTNWEEWRNVYE